MIYSLADIATKELILSGSTVLVTIVFCIWQLRPFGLWIIHCLLIQYLCLYWIPIPYGRVGIGLLLTLILVLYKEKRSINAL